MKAKLVKETLNENYKEKDIQRIKDLFAKSKGSDEKLLQLTNAMANSIDNVEKAKARAEAAQQVLGIEDNPIADIFIKRVKELGGNFNSSDIDNENIPFNNPELTLAELPGKGYKPYQGNPQHGGRRNFGGSNKGVIFLPTTSSFLLWDWEITGQLSDGAWENTKPDDHWIFWANLEPKLGQPQVQSDQRPLKTGYNLSSLLEYVGDEMLKYGRFGKAIGQNVIDMKTNKRSIIEAFPEEGPFELEEFKNNIMKKRNYLNNPSYWEGITQEMINKYYATKYEIKDLRKDLSSIKIAMKNIKIIYK
jgi:hypothetical protein